MISDLIIKFKIKKSLKIIKKAYKKYNFENIALAWTGGKDSTLLLWLIRNLKLMDNFSLPKIIFINEGDVFSEVEEFVNRMSKKWDFRYETVQNTDILRQVKKIGDRVLVSKLSKKNKQELKKLGFSGKSFPFEPESLIGNHLMKTVPMNLFLEKNDIKALMTGIRKDEQSARANETYFSPRRNPPHIRVHPLLHFSEKEIWTTTIKNNIPYVKLYQKGYRSLGARSSTFKKSNVPAWLQDLGNTSEREGRRQDKEQIMEKLRKLGYM